MGGRRGERTKGIAEWREDKGGRERSRGACFSVLSFPNRTRERKREKNMRFDIPIRHSLPPTMQLWDNPVSISPYSGTGCGWAGAGGGGGEGVGGLPTCCCEVTMRRVTSSPYASGKVTCPSPMPMMRCAAVHRGDERESRWRRIVVPCHMGPSQGLFAYS